MDYKGIREQFRKISGRYDLVGPGPEFKDTGAGFYINSGQKFLDTQMENPRSQGIFYAAVQAGQYYLNIPACRVIQSVWVDNAGIRTKLSKISYVDLRKKYMSALGSIVTSNPIEYSPAVTRMIPEGATPSQVVDSFLDTVPDNSKGFRSIIFMPAPSQLVTMEVEGLFYSRELEKDEHESYWSNNYSDILVMAALYKLEIMHRNKQGADDWLTSIQNAISGIDKDMVEEDIVEQTQWRG